MIILTYFGTRLSENISRREPEGYLICLNVPVARTGVQEYLPSELGLPGPDDRLIPVLRPEEEVFSPACIASFEGMPVTNDHPSAPDGVTAENSRWLHRGHAQHVRRGAGAESDLLLADLMIHDPALIEEILGGKREISCGYTYTLCEEEGHFIQREIRGNHVAVVDSGRAGPRVSIRDREPDRAAAKAPRPVKLPADSNDHAERSKHMKKKSLWRAKLMARMARDGDVDGLAELITEVMEAPAAAAAAAEEAAPAAGDPLVNAVAGAVAENLEAAAREISPEAALPADTDIPAELTAGGEPEHPGTDCGPEILEALRRIIALLGGAADCGPAQKTGDEEGGPAVIPAVAEAAAEGLAEAATQGVVQGAAQAAAENLAGAAAQAAAEALGAGAGALGDAEGDPVETLVAEILEAGGDEDPEARGPENEDPAADDEDEILSGILEPLDGEDEEDPEEAARTADALRAALASFRPQLKRMTPRERQRFNADVAARMQKLSRRAAKAGKANAYEALRKAGARDESGRSLGRKIMAGRNVNMKR